MSTVALTSLVLNVLLVVTCIRSDALSYEVVFDDAPTTIRLPTKTEFSSGKSGVRSDADLMWKLHNGLRDQGEENATMSLLKLYNCPLYSDRFGIDEEQSAKTDANATTSLSAFSAIPTTEETWTLFEKAYMYSLGITLALKEKPNDGESKRQGAIFSEERGMLIPHEIRYSPIVGRSVHTTTFVPKDTLVWSGSYTVAFVPRRRYIKLMRLGEYATRRGFGGKNEYFRTYRRFIEYLHEHHTNKTTSGAGGNGQDGNSKKNHPHHNWACDALMWSYTSDIPNSNDYSLCLAFDNGSMFNDAKGNATADNLANDVMEGPTGRAIGCLEDDMVASRDIQPGEGTHGRLSCSCRVVLCRVVSCRCCVCTGSIYSRLSFTF